MLGIDFGTTHTTAALYDGHSLQFIPLDEQAPDPTLLRSMLYITQGQQCVLGAEAVARYLRENSGRPVEYVWKSVGTIQSVFAGTPETEAILQGPIVMEREVYVQEDVAAPGRLLQSIKSALRARDYTGTHIYGRFYSLEALIALLLTHIREKAEAHRGRTFRRVVLGRPVRFAEQPEEDALAEQRLSAAAHLAGFEEVSFVAEPVAAAHFYLQSQQVPQTLLVFDFGGGTLDLTVMRGGGSEVPAILATQGVLVGGDDFDRALMREKVSSYFGTSSVLNSQGHPFPLHLASKLEQWQTIPELCKDDYRRIIQEGQAFSPTPEAFHALDCLASKNYGFALLERIEQAKRTLSTESQARLELRADAIDLALDISRREFVTAISGEVGQVRQGMGALLRQAQLHANAIDVVVTTGGSARIPIFQQLLQKQFPEARHVRSNEFGSVGGGAAICAYQRYGRGF